MTDRGVPRIFSAKRRFARESRARALRSRSPASASWLAEAMAEEAIERIGFMKLEPASAFLAGEGIEAIAAYLRGIGCGAIRTADADHAEDRPLPGGPYDLVVSLARLDTVNDLPGALLHIRGALSRDGIAMVIIPGAGSLPILRRIMLEADADRAAARIHPQVDTAAATSLLERAGFARQVVDSFALTVRFSSLARLVGDLREQGMTSALSSAAPPLGKQAHSRALEAFGRLADEDGKVSETFEILALTGWKS